MSGNIQGFSKVKKYLETQKNHLEKQLTKLTKDDPYFQADRTSSTEPATDAYEYEGHERITLLKANLSKGLDQVKKALSLLNLGKYGKCEKCGLRIDVKRLEAFPEATLCVNCEKKVEKRAKIS